MAQRDTNKRRLGLAAPLQLPARLPISDWRAALATGVASAALFAYGARPARAQTIPSPCVVSSTDASAINCTGDLSAGVTIINGAGAFQTLNVFDLTTDVGAGGIRFTSVFGITINSDTNPFAIISTSTGIYANSFSSQAVTIRSNGDIVSVGNGIDGNSGAGDVAIASSGDIATTGANANGIYAYAYNGTIAIASTGDITTQGGGGYGIRSFGSLGATSIASLGNITTAGDYAMGIGAYSLQADVAIASTGNITTGGNSAHGIITRVDSGAGEVAITSTGNITTMGSGAVGILVDVGGSGDVAIASFGNITTSGTAAGGIAAVTSGSVEILNTGDILASGTGSAGIYAAGQAGTLVVNFGNVEGCPCAGVIMMSIGTNQLTNYGSIIADPSGNAIEAMGNDNLVENFGTITGSVLMAGVTSVFNNNAGALFNSGDDVIADVSNAGTLAPGGHGVVETTDLTGNIVQSASGVFAVDIDGSTVTSDQILATGIANTADLAGNVAVTMTSIPLTAAQSYLILQAPGGATDNGLGLIASPALHATLSFQNGTDVVLGVAIDFSLSSLNGNQKAIAENLDKIFHAGVGGVGPVILGLLNTVPEDEYKNALDQLSPELYSDAEIAALYSSLAFSNSLLSCKVNGTDTAAIIREGQCLWAGASARFLDAGTTSDQIGYTETAGLFTAGAQVALDDVWRFGAAAGYQNSTLQTATGAQSEGALGQGGVALKYNAGPLLVAGTVSGGGGQYDTRRVMSFGGFTGVAEGDQELGFVAAGFRAAYVFGSPHLYWKPILDANLTRLQLGGFTESGGNGAALAVDGGGQTVFSLAPTLETGTEWWLANGTLLRPLLRAGAIWYEGADFAMTASFAGAPLGVSPFTINTDIDEVMGLVGAGVEVINGGDAVLRLSYDGQLGETTQIHSVGIKGSAKF